MTRGRTSQEHGAELEMEVEAFHRTLKGWYCQKNHPGFKKVGARWIPDPKQRGAPDFLCSRAGKVVLFDAKNCASERWPVCLDIGDGEWQGLQPHQHTAMRRMVEAGGRAGVLLGLPTGRYWVDFAVVGPVWSAWWNEAKEVREVRYLSARDGIRLDGCDWVRAVFGPS